MGQTATKLRHIDANTMATIADEVTFRQWGHYKILSHDGGYKVKRLVVDAGRGTSLQFHHKRAEYWLVTSGTATVTHNERSFTLNKGESTFIPVGHTHRLANLSAAPLTVIEIQMGDYLEEDDIVRLDMRLEDALKPKAFKAMPAYA